jgi:hypothetical protein
MSYTYLQEREAGFWEESCSDTPQFALWKLNLTAEKFYCNASETESCQSFQYGTTLKPSTERLGVESRTSCAAASRAKTSVWPAKVPVSKASGADYGEKCAESLARFDPASCSWKTRQLSLFGGELESLANLPDWGMTARGELWPLTMSEHLTSANGFGYLPTPVKADGGQGTIISERDEYYITGTGMPRKINAAGTDGSVGLSRLAGLLPTPNCGDAKNPGGNQNQNDLTKLAKHPGKRLSPLFSEWMMGWPIGWTDIMPLEMDKFQKWWNSHGKSFQQNNHLTD